MGGLLDRKPSVGRGWLGDLKGQKLQIAQFLINVKVKTVNNGLARLTDVSEGKSPRLGCLLTNLTFQEHSVLSIFHYITVARYQGKLSTESWDGCGSAKLPSGVHDYCLHTTGSGRSSRQQTVGTKDNGEGSFLCRCFRLGAGAGSGGISSLLLF